MKILTIPIGSFFGLICGVVGLICALRESYQSISFILTGQFENIDHSYWFNFWTDSDLFATGGISPWKLQNSCKTVHF